MAKYFIEMYPEIVLPIIAFNAGGGGRKPILYWAASFITGMTTRLPISSLDLIAELLPIMSIAMTSPEQGGQRSICMWNSNTLLNVFFRVFCIPGHTLKWRSIQKS